VGAAPPARPVSGFPGSSYVRITCPLVGSLLSQGVGESRGFYERNDADDIAALASARQLRMQLAELHAGAA